MTDAPLTGHDGPYPAPVELPGGRVQPDWIDYNGHMNVAYYTLAFDRAVDRLLEDHLGIGESHVAATRHGPYTLQAHIHYLGEMLEGAAYTARALLLAADAKRFHLVLELLTADGGVAATCEQVLMNVDLDARRSAPYPGWAQARLARMVADHADAPRPPQTGAPIGLRPRG